MLEEEKIVNELEDEMFKVMDKFVSACLDYRNAKCAEIKAKDNNKIPEFQDLLANELTYIIIKKLYLTAKFKDDLLAID